MHIPSLQFHPILNRLSQVKMLLRDANLSPEKHFHRQRGLFVLLAMCVYKVATVMHMYPRRTDCPAARVVFTTTQLVGLLPWRAGGPASAEYGWRGCPGRAPVATMPFRLVAPPWRFTVSRRWGTRRCPSPSACRARRPGSTSRRDDSACPRPPTPASLRCTLLRCCQASQSRSRVAISSCRSW